MASASTHMGPYCQVGEGKTPGSGARRLHTAGMKPERVLAVVVGIIVVIAAVAAVVASRRDAVVYDADTPEGAVQAYLRAVIDDDHDAADAYLDPAADCDWA